MTIPSAYISRPKVLIAGKVNDALSVDILSVLVEETIDGLYRCEACFNNYGKVSDGVGYVYLGRDILDFGKDFAIQLGPQDQTRQVFKGRISGLEAEVPDGGSGKLIVLAEDRLQDLRMTRRSRTFEDVSDAEPVVTICVRRLVGEEL